ncbi:hypothetical protein LC048_06270 [Mesobacillus subterraneus]|uniref:hypothetical protein n=1 Tax=Mesobacillus subterraneus TaxID=285983 RepID=UPI001CFEB635|nr:hypothetical protein [Mesobacillus subterraneus]WLR56507.1 hypothetical protein LC048_06270 [Mesobacillus subterraneus]
MEKKTFEVEEHHLVEIKETKPFGSNGSQTRTYHWEVFIASKGTEYRGKAIEPKDQKREIPWMTIEEHEMNPLDFMVECIERKFHR